MPIQNPPWREATPQARAEYETWQQRPPVYAKQAARLDLWQMVRDLEAALPEDFIICNGAGNFATWGHRFHRYTGMRTQLAPTAGSMGYGVPAPLQMMKSSGSAASRSRTICHRSSFAACLA